MNTNVVLGLAALLVVGGIGYMVVSSGETSQSATGSQSDVAISSESELAMKDGEEGMGDAHSEPMMDKEEDMMKDEAMEDDEMMEGEAEASGAAAPASASGSYQVYDPENIASTDADRIALFFHASWCPTCRALDADITANEANIPADVAIFKVDYDTATALKQQYGITRQHSVVMIDGEGNAQGTINHPATLAQLVAGL